MDIKAIGKRARERRNELGLTQKEVAEAAGVTREFITAFEAGYRLPATLTLTAIAEELSISLDKLVLGHEDHAEF